jgi:hypothetical protein
MLKKLIALTLVVVLANLGYASSAFAQGKDTDAQKNAPSALSKEEAKRARKSKEIVSGLGFGQSARVTIRLRDKTELKGFVAETADDYFILMDEHGAATLVAYAQVDKLKPWPTAKTGKHRGASLGSRIFTKIAIGTIIVVGTIALVCGIGRRCEE